MDIVEQVKSACDIVQVIGEHVRLKKLGGSGRYIGLCPFHQEKTPSFSVHAGHQFFKCFGCGIGGDVFKFVMDIERVSFFDALKLLAEQRGIAIPKHSGFSDPESKLRAVLLDMHEIAARHFQEQLHASAGAEARAYLAKRGVSSSVAEEFGLGYAPDSWDGLTRRLQRERFADAELDQSGLVGKRSEGNGFYDRFRGRLMFPIHNEAGKVIGFGGRALKDGKEAKYLNSPETALYRKSYVLYNLHRAKDAIRRLDRAVLVEGYMDVIGVFAAGVREVVASCGTALTNTQARIIKKHSQRILVNFDSDAAGAKAAEKSIQMLLEEGLRVRVLELDGGLDPDEYVKKAGAAAYQGKLDQAAGYFHWLSSRARSNFDTHSVEGRMAGLNFLLPAIQHVPDKLERAAIAEEVAAYLGVERGLVLEQFRKAAVERSTAPAANRVRVPATEKLLLNALLASTQARQEVLPRLRRLSAFERFGCRRILEALAALDEAGQRLAYSELEARLTDADRDLLASAIFADELDEGAGALEQALGCLEALEVQESERKRAALRDQIKAAERSGNLAEAFRLAGELNRFPVKRSAGRAH